ncbi:RCC1 and BTB domain-containing protein 2-like [Ischnura elegans]|uniref:RCC1 and BTB domain-containing protein 2-like n=1 Tax=Ischnura elegans TaxID=197161 RepID=UPI001ED8BFDB|nr:RCC1 and BTB domain-containing protein 2-like [Ischnura elegans]
MELQMYSICAYVGSDLLEVVEKAFFLDDGHGALLLTRYERLYAVGRVFSSTLGLGRHFIPKQLIKLPFPNDEKIQDFATRGTYCAALTREGTVFHWGGSINTPLRVFCLRDHCAIQIASGENFLMALCTNGQVWAWQRSKFCVYKIIPRDEDLIEADSPSVIKMVGIFRPILLTKGGKIYTTNESFMSTVAPIKSLTKPMKLSQHEKVLKLVCGKFRVYGLNERGVLYTWNEYCCSKNIFPEIISSDPLRFLDIRASLDNDDVIGADSTGKLFKVYKDYGGNKLWTFVGLKNSSFNDYEAANNLSSYGYKETLEVPVETTEESKLAQVKWLRKLMDAFNNPGNSDITFVVEGKMIYAHQSLLEIQCEPLKRAFQSGYKNEFNRIIMPIENVSHTTFYRFIKFMYVGQLDIGSSKGNIELLKLVHSYEYEPLMGLCEKIIIRGLRMDNACSLHFLASSLGLKDLKEESIDYIRQHQAEIETLGHASEVAGILESACRKRPLTE